MPDTVYDELYSTAQSSGFLVDMRPAQSDQQFLHELVGVLSKIPEDKWEALSKDAQSWYDSTLDDKNNLKVEIPLPVGYQAKLNEPAPTPVVRRRVVSQPEPTPEAVTPQVPPEPTLFEAIMAAVRTVKPDFADKHAQESDQLFLARALRYLSRVQDPSAAIKQWIEAADAAAEYGKPAPLPAGYTATEVKGNGHDVEEALPSSIESDIQRLAKGETTGRRGRKAAKEPAATLAPKGRERDSNSVTNVIRQEVTRTWGDSVITVPQLSEVLADRNLAVKPTTIHQTRAAHIASLRVAQEMGWQPPDA